MTKVTGLRSWSLILALGFGLGACGGGDSEPEPEAMDNSPTTTVETLRVTSLDLGKSVDANRRVTSTTNEFMPGDTIYASVVTQGSANSGMLAARWTYQDGQVVDESSQSISSTMSSATEFHISRPDGFPAGSYSVEIMLNGEPVENEDFTVR